MTSLKRVKEEEKNKRRNIDNQRTILRQLLADREAAVGGAQDAQAAAGERHAGLLFAKSQILGKNAKLVYASYRSSLDQKE